MRDYEGMFIIRPDLSDEDCDKTINSIGDTIAKFGGQVAQKEKWPKRVLSYRIKKCTEGIYSRFEFKTEPSGIIKMEQNLKLNPNIIRILIIKKEG